MERLRLPGGGAGPGLSEAVGSPASSARILNNGRGNVQPRDDALVLPEVDPVIGLPHVKGVRVYPQGAGPEGAVPCLDHRPGPGDDPFCMDPLLVQPVQGPVVVTHAAVPGTVAYVGLPEVSSPPECRVCLCDQGTLMPRSPSRVCSSFGMVWSGSLDWPLLVLPGHGLLR